jgi:GGDEF domain-containing protein
MSAVREQLQAGRSGVVVVADVDGLHAFDERHGYASGNLVLCELARILGRRGTAGRLGGDALALWAPIAAAETAGLAAQIDSDVRTRFAADGVVVQVALGSAPAGAFDDIGAVLQTASAAVDHSRRLRAA